MMWFCIIGAAGYGRYPYGVGLLSRAGAEFHRLRRSGEYP